MKSITSLLVMSLVLAACSGCAGGGNKLIVGNIKGPGIVSEGMSANYTVEASGDTGITYKWAVDPIGAGEIANSTTNSVTLSPNDVDTETTVRLRVVVNSSSEGPVVRETEIIISNVPGHGVRIGDISGPDELSEYIRGVFEVNPSGSPWFNYKWSCKPSDAGTFDTPTENMTGFRAGFVDAETEIEIRVEVGSDYGGSVERSLAVTILNPYDPKSFLGGGHPLDGVDFRRSNRSGYALPGSLSGGEVIEPPYPDPESPFEFHGSFHDLVVAGDERLYLGVYLTAAVGGGPGSYQDAYSLWSFYFGDDAGPEGGGGMLTVLSTLGAYTISRSNDIKVMYGHGNYTWHSRYSSSAYRYVVWPDIYTETSASWGRYGDADLGMDIKWGDWDAPRFYDLLPLPDGSAIVAFAGDDYGPPMSVGRLSEDFTLIQETQLDGGITGIAFDGDTGVTYVATGVGLYSYSWDFSENWNTFGTIMEFSETMPVIADDRGILGCLEGTLRRIEPDGSPGGETSCGAYLRPAILNDGTVAVITDSSILYLDPQLTQIGEIPLPGGPDTGDLYTRPPLIDSVDNMALFAGPDLYIISRNGDLLAQRTFESEIREIRLGPDHLFVASDYQIFRYPN